MEFGTFDGGGDGGHSRVDIVVITAMLPRQNVDVSTGVCDCCRRCSLQWLSHQPMMIEQCLNLNTLPRVNESICLIAIHLYIKMCFLYFGD